MAWTALKISAFLKNDVKSFQIRALAGNTASESSACHRSCWAKACSLVVTLLSMWQKKTEEMCSRGHDLLELRSQELFIATGLNGSEKQWNDTTQLWRVLWYFLRQLLLSSGDKKLPYFEKKCILVHSLYSEAPVIFKGHVVKQWFVPDFFKWQTGIFRYCFFSILFEKEK